MSYVVLPAVGQAERMAVAEARWAAMAAARPDLGPAIALQRKLIGVVVDLMQPFQAGRTPRLSLPPRYLTTKLRSGIPALTGEPIQLPVEVLRPGLIALVRALADAGAGDATTQIRAALEEERLDIGALLMLTIRRQQGALRVAATRAGLGHDLLWLVADLAVSPLAHAWLSSLFGAAEAGSPLRSALDGWSRGYCPLCGTWPAYVEDVNGGRRLRCAFCAAAWEIPAGSCLFCAASGEGIGTLAPDPSRPGRHIETCRGCRGYAKVLESEGSLPFPLLALADLESMDLDMAAMQQGFARPALKQFVRR